MLVTQAWDMTWRLVSSNIWVGMFLHHLEHTSQTLEIDKLRTLNASMADTLGV